MPVPQCGFMYLTDSRADKLDESCLTKPLHVSPAVGRKYTHAQYFHFNSSSIQ